MSSTDLREARKFGAVALGFFALLSALAFWRQREVLGGFFGSLSLIGMGILVLPKRLWPVYRGWLEVGHFMGKTTNILFLTLAYFLVITPSGLLKRVFGGRPIPMKPDKKDTTYWIQRSEPVQPRERFVKRY